MLPSEVFSHLSSWFHATSSARRRYAESTRTDGMEYGHSRQSSFASNNHKVVTLPVVRIAMVPDDGKQVDHKSFRLLAIRIPPLSRNPHTKGCLCRPFNTLSSRVKAAGDGIRKPPRPACPPPFLLPLNVPTVRCCKATRPRMLSLSTRQYRLPLG